MLKLKIKSNFNFGKLATKMPDVLDNFLNDSYADLLVDESKKFIKSGQVTPPLKRSTIKQRKKEGYGNKALFKTGALTNSLKKSKKGLQLKAYGVSHYNGFTIGSRGIKVPSRPFLVVRNFNKLKKVLQKAIHTALRQV